MDFKDFKEGLISSSLILFIFSFTLLIILLFLKSSINLSNDQRTFLTIISSLNLFISILYFLSALGLENIFKLENKNVIKFGKKVGVITIIYTPHLIILTIFVISIHLHSTVFFIIILIILIESILIILVFKEVYDLVLMEDSRRNFEIEANRKKYIEKEKINSL
ncbi:MAG: hypothetical protein ACFE9Z_13290 [Promethearchaeota archaeon]